jgi:hypothetical protein
MKAKLGNCLTFARNFWESMPLSRRGGLRHPTRKITCWLTNLYSQNVHDKTKVITVPTGENQVFSMNNDHTIKLFS